MRRATALVIGVAAALGSTWAAVETRRRWLVARIAHRQLAALTTAVGSLARATAPDDVLAGVLRAIAEQLDASWVLLFLHDPNHDELALHLVLRDGQLIPRERATPNLITPAPARDVAIWADLERGRQPIHVADVRTHPGLRQRDALIAQGVRSMLVVPLIAGEALIGWFSVRDTAVREYRQDQLDLAAALAQQAALAVQLRRLGEQVRQNAVLEERNRIAREMHDTLAQGFAGILMQLEATESALETARPELARERLGRARELARTSLAEARRSVWALRPEALEGQPFVAALRRAAAELTTTAALRLDFTAEGVPVSLPPELEADLLRVVQEAMTNAVRHAAAQKLVVRLCADRDELELEIRDDGRGFEPLHERPADGSGFGLTAMRERVERHGGALSIESGRQTGTRVLVQVPLSRRPGARARDTKEQ